MNLTKEQKIAIFNYYLNGADKGLFESVDEFQTEEVENNFDEYMDAADELIDEIRQTLINRIVAESL